jgi:putative tryptophan/tyrosine transport system substrate-binding protein
MIAKRSLVGAAILIGLGAPIVGRTQASAKVHRIGLLASVSAQPRMPAPVEALREALRDLGLVEGRTIEIEYRWAEGRVERLPELAADLVRAKVELIVAAGDAPTRAAMAATRAIPIVMTRSAPDSSPACRAPVATSPA